MPSKENRRLYSLRNKHNKTVAEWKVLHNAGWVDLTYNSEDEPVYTMNEIGLAGGVENFSRDLARDKQQGTGRL